MDDHALKAVLVHQVNINLRLQEFMFDMIESSPDTALSKRMVRVLTEIQEENKAIIATMFPSSTREGS